MCGFLYTRFKQRPKHKSIDCEDERGGWVRGLLAVLSPSEQGWAEHESCDKSARSILTTFVCCYTLMYPEFILKKG
jgi:hypothetical protein